MAESTIDTLVLRDLLDRATLLYAIAGDLKHALKSGSIMSIGLSFGNLKRAADDAWDIVKDLPRD